MTDNNSSTSKEFQTYDDKIKLFSLRKTSGQKGRQWWGNVVYDIYHTMFVPNKGYKNISLKTLSKPPKNAERSNYAYMTFDDNLKKQLRYIETYFNENTSGRFEPTYMNFDDGVDFREKLKDFRIINHFMPYTKFSKILEKTKYSDHWSFLDDVNSNFEDAKEAALQVKGIGKKSIKTVKTKIDKINERMEAVIDKSWNEATRDDIFFFLLFDDIDIGNWNVDNRILKKMHKEEYYKIENLKDTPEIDKFKYLKGVGKKRMWRIHSLLDKKYKKWIN